MYEEDKDRNWNREPEEERPKKGGILKKAAWITAGALLFGTIAGGVMVGVQIASSGVFKNLYAIVSGEPEAGDWKAPEGQKPPADPFARNCDAVLYRCSGYRCVCHRGGSNAFGSGYHKHSRISEP